MGMLRKIKAQSSWGTAPHSRTCHLSPSIPLSMPLRSTMDRSMSPHSHVMTEEAATHYLAGLGMDVDTAESGMKDANTEDERCSLSPGPFPLLCLRLHLL